MATGEVFALGLNGRERMDDFCIDTSCTGSLSLDETPAAEIPSLVHYWS